MVRTTILLLALMGCKGGGSAAKPSADQCTAFITHAAALEESGDENLMHLRRYRPGDEHFHRLFMRGCPQHLTSSQIECALKAENLAALDKCVDREALATKFGY